MKISPFFLILWILLQEKKEWKPHASSPFLLNVRLILKWRFKKLLDEINQGAFKIYRKK